MRVGIRGSRNVEVIGDVSRGMAVLSPARPDLADGTRVRIDTSKQADHAGTRRTPDPRRAPDPTPANQTAGRDAPPAASAPCAAVAAAAPAPIRTTPMISSAISAHINSVVNDARRNVAKFANR